jgi:hypothetical protein
MHENGRHMLTLESKLPNIVKKNVTLSLTSSNMFKQQHCYCDQGNE